MMMEQSLFLGRIENPIQLQSCLGKNENTKHDDHGKKKHSERRKTSKEPAKLK